MGLNRSYTGRGMLRDDRLLFCILYLFSAGLRGEGKSTTGYLFPKRPDRESGWFRDITEQVEVLVPPEVQL